MANQIDPGSWAFSKEDVSTTTSHIEANMRITHEGESFKASANVGVQLSLRQLKGWLADKRFRFGKRMRSLFDSTGE